MQSDIADAGLDMRGTRVVVRSGSTWNIADLRKISAATAKVRSTPVNSARHALRLFGEYQTHSAVATLLDWLNSRKSRR